MESSDSSFRSKSEGEKGQSGGNLGLTSTFSASSFIVAEREVEARVRWRDGMLISEVRAGAVDRDGETKPAADSGWNDSRVRKLMRMVVVVSVGVGGCDRKVAIKKKADNAWVLAADDSQKIQKDISRQKSVRTTLPPPSIHPVCV